MLAGRRRGGGRELAGLQGAEKGACGWAWLPGQLVQPGAAAWRRVQGRAVLHDTNALLTPCSTPCPPPPPPPQVSYIEEKLGELDAERAELAAYQGLDKQRRSLEFTILDKEMADAAAKLAKVRAGRVVVGWWWVVCRAGGWRWGWRVGLGGWWLVAGG